MGIIPAAAAVIGVEMCTCVLHLPCPLQYFPQSKNIFNAEVYLHAACCLPVGREEVHVGVSFAEVVCEQEVGGDHGK